MLLYYKSIYKNIILDYLSDDKLSLFDDISRSKLPCLFINCIFLTLSANESVLLIVITSSLLSRDFCGIVFIVSFCWVADDKDGGLLIVNDSSTFSKLTVLRRLTGIWTFTIISSFDIVDEGLTFCVSSKSGVDDQELGLCRNFNGAVTSIILFSACEAKFDVDVQLRIDFSKESLLRLGVDDAKMVLCF